MLAGRSLGVCGYRPMRRVFLWCVVLTTVVMVANCVAATKGLSSDQTAACKRLGLDANEIAKLIEKPLYKCTESEVDQYLKFLSATEPDLRKRIVHLARKNIGQP